MQSWISFDDYKAITTELRRLTRMGGNMADAMRDIAALGESTTRMRFRTETAPDGTKWKKSMRAALSGGKTLTKDGHLGDSASAGYGSNYAEWGLNRVYAAIHHFGGVIRAKAGGMLRFRLANGGYATVASVTIPARPALGVNEDDRDDILDIIAGYVRGARA